MDEKTMVNDILEGVKAGLTAYQTAITETENTTLSFQFELFKVAQAKGYYKSAQKATPAEIGNLKSELQ